jgi:acyl carrier protein
VNSEPVIKRLKKLLVNQLNLGRDPESIPDNISLFREGLGLDSIDSLEIIIGIEREFKLSLSDEQLKEPDRIFRSVRSLADFVEERLKAK